MRSPSPSKPSALLHAASNIDRIGIEFFRLTYEQDLEESAKLKHGRYGEGWFQIRNPHYSQRERRREVFGMIRQRSAECETSFIPITPSLTKN